MSKTVVLSGGRTFEVNEVGPQAWVVFFEHNPPPSMPMGEKTNDAGTVIKVQLPDNDPRMLEWGEQVEIAVRKRREVGYLALFDGRLEVPANWKIPRAFGIETPKGQDEKLVRYVQFEVIKTADDVDALDRASNGDITPQEVEAQSEPFKSN